MRSPRGSRNLQVLLFGQPVGELSIGPGRLAFAYCSDWLSSPDAVPLSQSLPLRREAFDDAAARPFFAGLLPEGTPRRELARMLQVSVQNDFGLLERIGGECAGAVSLVPLGAELPRVTAGRVQWVNDQELAALLESLPLRPMLADLVEVRLSLAGAQNKLPVVVSGDQIGIPLDGALSTHILKPAIHGLDGTVANEAFCLSLASTLGLKAAPAQVRYAEGQAFLLVERYDRIAVVGADSARLHQEDFCQALGVIPEQKYQNEGGPDVAQCFALVRAATRPSAPRILQVLDYVFFNALIGNHDAHGKNFSLIYKPSGVDVAPLYDALSTAVYPNLTPKMAMKIGGRYKFTELESRHWDRLFSDAGLSPANARKRLLAMARRLPGKARELQVADGFSSEPIIEQVVEIIEHRAALTLARLTGLEQDHSVDSRKEFLDEGP